MNEFDLIRRYFADHGVRRDDVPLGIGDDAALLIPPPGQSLAVTVDTLHSGVHFAPDIPPTDLGYKALAVNLSDLAAMGAEPAWATLALSLPQADEAWLAAFAEGFFVLAECYNVQLVGGDTTRGPLSVTLQLQGFVPRQKALIRSGARPGDHVFVTGSLGDAGAGLAIAQGRWGFAGPLADFLLTRLHRPTPRVGAGLALRGLATAAIDISDGLAQDLGHILTASGVGAVLNIDHLPLSDALLASGIDRPWRLAVSAGDDYELCFTVPADADLSVSGGLDCPVTRIGRITAEPGQRWQDAAGVPCEPPAHGWDHFAGGGA
ncbi:MAG TPA: thiamine-phosphate kinase [Gammaproteobacteria bacterium]|nr:thiamine-phosphate kinase [Gammaproteobacteria bacterium]